MVYRKVDRVIKSSLQNWNLLSPKTQNSFPSKERKGTAVAATSFPVILLLLDLWRVPIIILIATTGAQPTCAISIAAVSISPSHDDKTNSSDNYDVQQKLPSKLSFNSNDIGESSSGGSLSLSFGGLVFNSNDYQHGRREPDSLGGGKTGLVKRGGVGGGETRITSNQDVTTLALAVDNSSSVAIANINSSWNNVYVTIGTPTGNHFQYPKSHNM